VSLVNPDRSFLNSKTGFALLVNLDVMKMKIPNYLIF